MGMTKEDFAYKITWDYLSQPIIVSCMINHCVLILIALIYRINLAATFNREFEESMEVVHYLGSLFKEMRSNARFYFYDIP